MTQAGLQALPANTSTTEGQDGPRDRRLSARSVADGLCRDAPGDAEAVGRTVTRTRPAKAYRHWMRTGP